MRLGLKCGPRGLSRSSSLAASFVRLRRPLGFCARTGQASQSVFASWEQNVVSQALRDDAKSRNEHRRRGCSARHPERCKTKNVLTVILERRVFKQPGGVTNHVAPNYSGSCCKGKLAEKALPSPRRCRPKTDKMSAIPRLSLRVLDVAADMQRVAVHHPNLHGLTAESAHYLESKSRHRRKDGDPSVEWHETTERCRKHAALMQPDKR